MLFSSLLTGLAFASFAHAAPKASTTCSRVIATEGLQIPQNCGTYGTLDQTLVDVIDTQSTVVRFDVI